MEKITIKKQRFRATDNSYRVRVSQEVKEKLEELCERTLMSEKDLCSKLLLWAMDRVEVEDD